MTGKSHQAIGLTVATVSYILFSEPTYGPAALIAVLVAAHFGSLMPDLDSSAAQIWSSVPFGRTVSPIASELGLGHRNFTHSLLGVAFFGWLTWELTKIMPAYWGLDSLWLWGSFMIGYACHLLADMVTILGVPLLWPKQNMYGLPPKPFEGIRIITGGWFENLVVFPLVNLIFVAFIWVYWAEFGTRLFQ